MPLSPVKPPSRPSTPLARWGCTSTPLAITPPSPSLPKGSDARLSAIGSYDDGTTKDLTSQVSWGGAGLSFSGSRYGFATSTASGATSVIGPLRMAKNRLR